MEDWRKRKTFQQPTALIALSVYACLERGDVLRTALHLRSDGEPCSKHRKCAIKYDWHWRPAVCRFDFLFLHVVVFCLDVGFTLPISPLFPLFCLFVCFYKMSWKSVEPRKKTKLTFEVSLRPQIL